MDLQFSIKRNLPLAVITTVSTSLITATVVVFAATVDCSTAALLQRASCFLDHTAPLEIMKTCIQLASPFYTLELAKSLL